VWCEYVLVHETSSLTLMVAGICKEILTVLAAVVVFGERLGAVNGLGLGVTVVGVLLFNLYKYGRVRAGEIAAAQVRGGEGGCWRCRGGRLGGGPRAPAQLSWRAAEAAGG
jgi:solute carrier family 35 protein C2